MIRIFLGKLCCPQRKKKKYNNNNKTDRGRINTFRKKFFRAVIKQTGVELIPSEFFFFRAVIIEQGPDNKRKTALSFVLLSIDQTS